MGKDKSRNNSLKDISSTAKSAYTNLQSGPTGIESALIPQSYQYADDYAKARDTQNQNYGDIMGGYKNFASNLAAPQKFSAQGVGVSRPDELNQAYGYLNKAAPGYQNFADTGGYSPQDIQELRARGSAPITSAYSNAMMETNRARTLGGAGGSPNYIAALSRMQRELPQQLATATTGVNAQLADAIRQGKLSGLSGLTGIGSTMGGMAGAESGRQLQAGIANQGADLQAQGLNQNAENAYNAQQLGALSGQTSLYGTTPAMASTFGSQALGSMGQRLTAEQMRNQQGLGLLGTQTQATGATTTSKPWWEQVLGVAGSVVPYLGKMGGGETGGMGGSGTGGFNGQGFGDAYGNSNFWDGYNFGNEGGYANPYFEGVPPGGTYYAGG